MQHQALLGAWLLQERNRLAKEIARLLTLVIRLLDHQAKRSLGGVFSALLGHPLRSTLLIAQA